MNNQSSNTMKRRLIRTLVICVSIACLAGAITIEAQAQAANEYQVKAAFILNFAKFVEWPGDAFSDSGSLVVGVIGDDPFGSSIDRIVNGSNANGRRLVVRRLKWGDNLRTCQILYISSSEKKRLGQILDSLRGSGTLTISDVSHFNQTGGMIRFFINDDKVRFEINATAAGQARLRISSKLMALSKGGGS
jgi:hypothetical protein